MQVLLGSNADKDEHPAVLLEVDHVQDQVFDKGFDAPHAASLRQDLLHDLCTVRLIRIHKMAP